MPGSAQQNSGTHADGVRTIHQMRQTYTVVSSCCLHCSCLISTGNTVNLNANGKTQTELKPEQLTTDTHRKKQPSDQRWLLLLKRRPVSTIIFKKSLLKVSYAGDIKNNSKTNI